MALNGILTKATNNHALHHSGACHVNTLTVIGTEYGKNHESTGSTFHAVAGGAGRFKPGQYDALYGFDDLYKTLMDSYNVPHEIGGNTISDLLT